MLRLLHHRLQLLRKYLWLKVLSEKQLRQLPRRHLQQFHHHRHLQ
jgi:hypothetical protein